MTPPKISIIIPCYNQGLFLKDALENILGDQDIEIIIVNDGSTEPETIQVLKSLENSACKIIHQKNAGLSNARNTGIKNATSSYILLLDADNIILKDYYEKAIHILRNDPTIGIVYSNPILFGTMNGQRNLEPFDIAKILYGNYIDACAIIRKEVWEQTGGYDEKLFGYEDWEFWISAYKKGWKFHFINDYLFKYRVRKNSLVSFCNQEENQRKLYNYIFQKHIDLYQSHHYEIVKFSRINNEKLQSTINELVTQINIQSREIKELRNFIDNLGIKELLKKIKYKSIKKSADFIQKVKKVYSFPLNNIT